MNKLDTLRKLLRNNFLEKLIAYPTKYTNSLLGKLMPGNYLYSSGTYRVKIKNGIKMKLDISEYVQHYIFANYIDSGLIALVELAKPGMVVYDIGANIGWTTLNLAKKVMDNGVVYAFEPNLINFKKSKINFALNPQIDNIIAVNIGFGFQDGEYKLYEVDERNNGMHQVRIDNDLKLPYTLIKIKTIDEYLTLPPSLIKIDTEGYEMNILKGAINALTNHRPLLFIEVDDNNLKIQKSSASELIEFVISMKYKVQDAITKNEITLNDNFLNCHFDMICFPL